MLDLDHNFGDFVTFAALFMLGMCALIAIIVLGLSLLYSWETEWVMRCSSWSPSSSFSGWYF
jgi:hypothetical protein